MSRAGFSPATPRRRGWCGWRGCPSRCGCPCPRGDSRLFSGGQEVVAVAGGHALAEDLAGAHVQGREEVRGAMPDVVVGAVLAGVELDRQRGLTRVQTLR